MLPDGERPASIRCEDGRIAAIDPWSATLRGAKASAERGDVYDAGDLIVSPGIVDTHVHVNEPGRTDWEGFDTATRAAAAGGVTTIVDMPLNSIPATTTVEALEAKRAAARDRVHVDVAFWGGVVPGNAGALAALSDAGVRGFKCFLAPSGVDEFPHVGEDDLRAAMPVLARLGLPLLVHAEDPSRLTPPVDGSYAAFLASRPPEAERAAIQLVVRLAREHGARVHIVHVSCVEALEEIGRAKRDGVAITAETCPHYLTFEAGAIPPGATEYKCAPPIREPRHRAALWGALRTGVLDLVASDHSPSPPALKCPGDFQRAWGGVASLELGLPAVWTLALSRVEGAGHAQPFDIARWMSDAPARLAGLGARKGRIAIGLDADLMIWDPKAEITVDPGRLQQRHPLTPYTGRRLRGRVRTTFLRGERIWDTGMIAAHRGCLL